MEVNKELEANVDDLIGDLQPPAPVEPPVVEPPVVEPHPVEPPIEPPTEPPPVEDPPKVEPLVVEPPPAEPPPATPPPSVKDPKDAEIEAMRSTIEDLRRTIETVAAQASAPKSAEPPPAAAPTVMKFVEKEEELDQVLNSVDNFNSFMTNVVTKGNEQLVGNLSNLVAPLVDKIVTQKMAVNEFYMSNKDLAGNKAYVGMVANELAIKNPTWSLEDVIKELANEVRGKLRMSGIVPPQTPEPSVTPPNTETPAFVPGGGARPGGGGPSLTKLEAGIADLLEGAI